MNRLRILSLIWIALTAAVATAQCRSIVPEDSLCSCDSASRPVSDFYRLEIGASSARATYLSPLRYHGTEYTASGLWTKALPFSPRHAVMDFDAAIHFASLLNPAHSASMLKVGADFHFGMGWRKGIARNMQITVGGNVGFDIAALYLSRNSNNLVAVQAWTGVGLNASYSYRFKIGKIQAIAADRLQMPLLGAFFMPGYTESYYEIYLGNHRGLAHFAYPGSHIAINNLASLTLSLGRAGLEVGYRFDFRDSHANNLSINTAIHSLVLGIIPNFKL